MTHQQLDRDVALPKLGRDDAGCDVLHVDMDAFFASVELRERPELIGRPVIVGGLRGRGVVTSATYEARAFGVHSAMPMSQAIRRCPHAEVIEISHHKYSEASREVMAILAQFTPELEVVSVDEAFLNVASVRRSMGGSRAIGEAIRVRLRDELALPSSVGIGTTTSVAKIASTLSKPNGLLLVPQAQTVEFMRALPVRRLWGVGGATARALDSIAVASVADLVAVPRSALVAAVGKSSANRLLALANGEEIRAVATQRVDKSIGAERTFETDMSNIDDVRRQAREDTQTLLRRLRRMNAVARTVTVKLRFANFQTVERSHSVACATAAASTVNEIVDQLLADLWRDFDTVRLVGVRLSGLAELANVGEQLTLADVSTDQHGFDKIADQIVDRFGSQALTSARLLLPKERPEAR